MKKIFISVLFSAMVMIMVLLWLGEASQAAARQAGDLQSFTMVVELPPGEKAEAALDMQMALAELLEYLQQGGSIVSFTPYYGINQISVQGTRSVRNYLDAFPGVDVQDTFLTADQNPGLAIPDKSSGTEGTGIITGTVTEFGTSVRISNIEVTLWYFNGSYYFPIKKYTTGPDGNYLFTGLTASSNYKVQFEDLLGRYVKQYYLGKYLLPDANLVDVNDGQTTGGINAAMKGAGNISGKVVKLADNTPIKDIVVNAYQFVDSHWVLFKSTVTNSSGNFTLTALPAGQHRLRFSDSAEIPRYVTEYYPNDDLIALAEDVQVTAGGTTTINDVKLGGWGSLSGAASGQGGATNMPGIQVEVWENILGQWTQEISGTTSTATNGTYTAGFLGTRDYRLRFSDPYGMYLTEYYSNTLAFDSATKVHVELGSPTNGINIQLDLNPASPITHTFGTAWYLVGWPINLSNPAPESLFASINNTLDIVWDYDACSPGSEWTFYSPDSSINTLESIAPPQGYWVRHTGNASLAVQGQYPLETSTSLCAGWNLIGYPAARPRPVQDVLAPISGKFTLVYGYDGSNPADPWEKYDPAAPVGNDLTTLRPGRAYWINMKQGATLVIPAR